MRLVNEAIHVLQNPVHIYYTIYTTIFVNEKLYSHLHNAWRVTLLRKDCNSKMHDAYSNARKKPYNFLVLPLCGDDSFQKPQR